MHIPRLIPIPILAVIMMSCGGTPTSKPDPVSPDSSVPTLVSHTPTSDATDVSGGTDLILNFSKAMNTSKTFAAVSPKSPGVNSHWLNGNTTLKVSVLAVVIGQPPNVYSNNTKFTVTAHGEDESGTALTGPSSFEFTTQNLQDTTAPTVLDTIPANAATDVPPGLGRTFTATFSERMSSSVLTAINFVPDAGATNCVFTDSSNKTVQCTPTDGLLGNQFYIMTITTAAKDEAGNALAQLNAVNFNTGPTPDSKKPKVNSSQPSAATPVIDTNTTINVYFSEAMDKVATQAAFTFISPALSASQSLSFEWGSNGDALVIKRNPDFTHGETITWKMGAGAKDVSGNTLEAASTGTHSFKIYNLGTFKLYSDGSLDGQVTNKEVVTVGSILHTQAYSPFYTRGFVSFDLLQLPSEVTSYTLKSATLNVYQQSVGGTDDYAPLGNVVAENICYALLSPYLFSTFFDTAPISSGTTNVLATNSKVGYKTMEAREQVLFDIMNSGNLIYRSQWRLRFGKESNGSDQNIGFITWASGTAVQAQRPYLNITYLYP
jgi:hypothetical protein